MTAPKETSRTQGGGRSDAVHAAETLLSAAGIRQVILVDDQALAALDATAVGIVEELWSAKPSVLRRVFGKDLEADADIRAAQVREHVAALTDASAGPALLADLRKERDKLRGSGHLPAADDSDAAEEAHELFSGEIAPLVGARLRVLTPDQWDADGAAIIDAAFRAAGSGSIPELPDTLVLFDIDLSEAGRGKEAGRELAVNLIKRLAPSPVLCGVISSNVPPRDQRAQWNPGMDVAPEAMVFISKSDLASEPLEFVVELRRVLLAPFATRLRAIAKDVLNSSHEFAVNGLAKVDINDLVYSVIELSHDEGVPEIETLLRIYSSYHREAVQSAAAAAPKLKETVEQLRAISKLAPAAKRATKYSTWQHQRREMYDNVSEVNRLHRPLEVGDIFAFSVPDGAMNEAGGEESKAETVRDESYVLVGQRCHTVVRGKGRRQLRLGTLVRVLDNSSAPREQHIHELKWFGAEGATAYADFSDSITVPFDVLDLCVLTGDGSAKWSAEDSEPDGLLPGWRKRREALGSAAAQYVEHVRATYAALAADRADLVVPREPSAPSPLAATVTMKGTATVSYNCRRSGRLVLAHAVGMLGELAYYLSRIVFEVDMTRGLP